MAEATIALNWTNAAEVRRIVDALPAKIEKRVWRKACRAAAKVILPRARANAPKQTGQLRKALRVRALKRSRVYVGARVTVGADKWYTGDTFYAAFVEFGHKIGKRPSKNIIKSGRDKRQEVPGKHYLEKAGEQSASAAVATFVRVAEQELKAIPNG